MLVLLFYGPVGLLISILVNSEKQFGNFFLFQSLKIENINVLEKVL